MGIFGKLFAKKMSKEELISKNNTEIQINRNKINIMKDDILKLSKEIVDKKSNYENLKNNIIKDYGIYKAERAFKQDFKIRDEKALVEIILGKPEYSNIVEGVNTVRETYKYGRYGGGDINQLHRVKITFDEVDRIFNISKNPADYKLVDVFTKMQRNIERLENSIKWNNNEIIVSEQRIESLLNENVKLNQK